MYPTKKQIDLNSHISKPYVEQLNEHERYREAYRLLIGMMENLSTEDFKKLKTELNKIDKYIKKNRDK